MSLSIHSSSTEEYLKSASTIADVGSNSTLELSFESEQEAQLAAQALFIDKFYPEVFKLFPDFRKYDPTIALPKDIRAKALRLCPQNILGDQPDDLYGILTSLYPSDSHKLKGSMIGLFFESPLVHVIRLYTILVTNPKVVSIKLNQESSRVEVHFNDKHNGFWFSYDSKEIQAHDLNEVLGNPNLYLGISMPMTTQSWEDYMTGKMDNIQHANPLPDDFYTTNTVNDLYLIHVKNNKVAKTSVSYQSNGLKHHSHSPKAPTAENWLSVAAA